MDIKECNIIEDRDILQIMRAFAIIAVVAYHALRKLPSGFAVNTTGELLFSFHVNIFFVISGFLFEKKQTRYSKEGFPGYLKGKFKRIFVPYYVSTVLFSLAILTAAQIPRLADMVVHMNYKVKGIFAILTDPLWYHDPLFRSLWFSWCLFWYFMIAWFFRPKGLFRGKTILIVFGLSYVLNVLALSINDLGLFHVGYIRLKLIKYYQYFYLGQYLYSRFRGKLPISDRILILSVLGAAIVIIKKFSGVTFHNTILMHVVGQAESLIFAMSVMVLLLNVAMRIRGVLRGHMVCIGNSSYAIYLLNSPWIIPVIAVIMNKLGAGMIAAFLVMYLCGVYLSILLETIFKRILRICYENYKIA